MSLFRDLSHAAIAADLGKNSFKVFNTLLEQTIGYGKEEDNLTDRRLSYLSQVRIDRLRPAIQAILKTGIFERRESDRFDWCYRIGASYLEDYEKAYQEKKPNEKVQFFTPALPKNGKKSQKTEANSEKERHTALDLDPLLSSLQPLLQLLTPKPAISEESLSDTISAAINTAFQPLVQNIQALNQTLQQAENLATVGFTGTVPQQYNPQNQKQSVGGGYEDKEPRARFCITGNTNSHDYAATPSPVKSDSAKKKKQNPTSEKQTESRNLNQDSEKQTESSDLNANAGKQTDSENINLSAEQHTTNDGEITQQATTSENSSNTQTLAQTQTKPSTPRGYGGIDAFSDSDEDIPFYDDDDDKEDATENTAIATPINTAKQTENQIENTVQATPNDTTEQTENTNTAESTESATHSHTDTVAKPDAVKIEIPTLVSKYSHHNCYELLSELDEAQQNKVLDVFRDMEQNDKIKRSPTGLFIGLAKLEKKKRVSPVETAPPPAKVVFNGSPENPNIQYGYSQTPQPLKRAPAPMTEAEKQQAAQKEEEEKQKEQLIADYRNLEMLMLHCRYVNITLEEQAERYSMEHILELFPEVVAKFKRKYKGH